MKRKKGKKTEEGRNGKAIIKGHVSGTEKNKRLRKLFKGGDYEKE